MWFGGGSAGWTAADMPSQAGKVAIVTGASSGIGFITALELARHGAHVILACLSKALGSPAEREIQAALEADGSELAKTGRVEFMLLDVADPASVVAFAAAFNQRFEKLDLLINNAGVAAPTDRVTANGLEVHFGVNYLGHFQLTSLLLASLRRSDAARVVNVSSMLHRLGWLFLDFETVATKYPRNMDGYCVSKLFNLLFTYELHRRLLASQVDHVKVVAAHPGACHTDIFVRFVRSNYPWFLVAITLWLLTWMPYQKPAMGALPTLYAATSEDVASGEFYGPDSWFTFRGHPTKEQSDAASHSQENASRLWTLSENILKTSFDVSK